MTIDDLEQHLVATGHVVETGNCGGTIYLVIRTMAIAAGRQAGKTCDVAILHSGANPWVPESAVHVRPHLVQMGTASSQASPLGPEWQYLSRRFDRAPTPKSFLTHILTVLGEL